MLSSPATVIGLAEVAPDFAESCSAEDRQFLAQYVRVEVLPIRPGSWQPPIIDDASIGYYLVSGLMIRRVSFGRARSAEVVGPSDILRPWEDGLLPHVVPMRSEWNVIQDAQVALLDGRIAKVIGRFPELAGAVNSRLLRRSRSLAFLMAAQHFVRVTDRLMAALWHLAGMWGGVTTAGVQIPFHLTHQTLADIIGARRPSVSTALRQLRAEQRVTQDHQRRLLLLGDPPAWERESPDVAQVDHRPASKQNQAMPREA